MEFSLNKDGEKNTELKELRLLSEKYHQMTEGAKTIIQNMYDNADKASEEYEALKNIVYRYQPPTPEDILDPSQRWLPEDFIDSLFPEVKADFIELFSEKRDYNKVLFYGSTGLGKSVFLRLVIFYSIIFYHCLRSPKHFFKVAMPSLCIYIVSFDFDASKKLILNPLKELLQMSDRFVEVKRRDAVIPTQSEIGLGKIAWTGAYAGGGSYITLESGLKILIGNKNANEIRGTDLWSYFVTEISYFMEMDMGVTEEDLMRMIVDANNRIYRTVPNAKYAWTVIDTSARSKESKIEKYITETLSQDNKCFYRDRRRWDIGKLREKQCPSYNSDNSNVFEVVTGDGSIPAAIIRSAAEKEGINPSLIKKIPIDYLKAFEEDLITALRDIAGYPTSEENKFVQNGSILTRVFDNNLISNVEGIIIADASDSPERLIFNQVHPILFNNPYGAEYILKRAAREPRYLGIDLAKSNKGDLIGIAMCHKEYSLKLKHSIKVFDFAFAIGPGDVGINLQAIEDFILDLVKYGKINIRHGYIDTALSSTLKQNLNRVIERDKGFIITNSVDTSMNDYQNLLSGLFNEEIKMGKNIFFKNNMLSLSRTKNDKGKEKIDHSKGKITYKYNGDWNGSEAGIHMKDVADAVAQSYACLSVGSNSPTVIYEEENSRLSEEPGVKKSSIDQAFKRLNKHF